MCERERERARKRETERDRDREREKQQEAITSEVVAINYLLLHTNKLSLILEKTRVGLGLPSFLALDSIQQFVFAQFRAIYLSS